MPHRNHPGFGDRIQAILTDTGMSRVELAAEIGVKKQSVTEWLSGRSKSARGEILFEIEDKLGYSARWLATGEGPRKIEPTDSTMNKLVKGLSKLSPETKNYLEKLVEFELSRSR